MRFIFFAAVFFLSLLAANAQDMLRPILPGDDEQTRREKMNHNFQQLYVLSQSEFAGDRVIFDDGITVSGVTTLNGALIAYGTAELRGGVTTTNTVTLGSMTDGQEGKLHIVTTPADDKAIVYMYDPQPRWQFSTAVNNAKWSIQVRDMDSPGDPPVELITFERVGNQWQASSVAGIIGGGGPGGDFSVLGTSGLFSWAPDTSAQTVLDDIDRALVTLIPQGYRPISTFRAGSGYPSFVSGYLSAGLSPAVAGGLSAGTFLPQIGTSTNMTVRTGENTFIHPDRGFMQIISGGSTLATLNLGQGTGQLTALPLQRLAVSTPDDITAWRHATLIINGITGGAGTPWRFLLGRNQFTLQHEVYPGHTLTADADIFIDNRAGIPSAAMSSDLGAYALHKPDFPAQFGGVSQFISGIRYMSARDALLFDARANNVFNRTYVTNILTYTTSFGPPGSINMGDTGVSPSIPPSFSASLNVTARPAQIAGSNTAYTAASITFTAHTPFGSTGSFTYTGTNLFVCLFPVLPGEGRRSTDTHEFFSDERYRIFADINPIPGSVSIDSWDRETALPATEAQLFPGPGGEMWLTYPRHNFSSGWSPQQPQNRDYSGRTGAQRYARFFVSPVPSGAFTLHLGGVSGSGVVPVGGSSGVSVEVAVPGATGWNDIFSLSSGMPSLSGRVLSVDDGASMHIVLGGRSTGVSGRVFVRISLNDENAAVRDMQVSWE